MNKLWEMLAVTLWIAAFGAGCGPQQSSAPAPSQIAPESKTDAEATPPTETASPAQSVAPAASKAKIETIALPEGSAEAPGVIQVGGPQQSAAPADPKALLEEWNAMAAHPRENIGQLRAQQVIAGLIHSDPAATKAILKSIDDPAVSPEGKVFAALSLAPFIQKDSREYLVPLTAPGKEATTRTCATHLLAVMANAENESLFRSLLEDPERRVRMAARLGLLRMNAKDAHNLMAKSYDAPDASQNDKNNIVQYLTQQASKEDAPLLNRALANPDTAPSLLIPIARALARQGDESSLKPLETLAASTQDPQVKRNAETAIKAITARMGKTDATPESTSASAPSAAS